MNSIKNWNQLKLNILKNSHFLRNMSDDFFLILFLRVRPPVFDDQIDCWMQQFFGLRRYVISFQYNLLLQIYSNNTHLERKFWQHKYTTLLLYILVSILTCHALIKSKNMMNIRILGK
jgi:hypothetical protein